MSQKAYKEMIENLAQIKQISNRAAAQIIISAVRAFETNKRSN